MRRLIFIFLILIVIFPFSKGQNLTNKIGGKLKGVVKDKDENTSLQYATITVFSKDSVLVGGGIASKDGSFLIDLQSGDYYAVVQFISYEKQIIRDIKISQKNPVFNAGTISLAPQSSALSEVTVRGEKSEMLVALDRKVFNVGKDLSSTGKSALDILDNIPSVSVDVDGNVSLRGSQNLQILIDGKPSGLYTADNTDALKNLQGNIIEKIEVITNPSSKYQADGVVGIINIILKKDQQKGVNGTFNLTAGSPKEYAGSMNVNFRREKLNYFFNYGIHYSERPGSGNSFQEFFDSTHTLINKTNVESSRLRTEWSNNLRGGADYYINSKNSLTGEIVVGLNKEKNNSEIGYKDLDSLGSLQKLTQRNSIEDVSEKEIESSINYEKKFDQKDRKLTAMVQYFYHMEPGTSVINEDSIPLNAASENINLLKQRDTTTQSERNFLLQTDYIHPFGTGGKIETGLRGQFRKIENPYSVYNLDTSNYWVNQPLYTNHFKYTENIYAGYLQTSYKFGMFTAQVGLRVEASDVRTHLEETNSGSNNFYVDFFPSVHTTFQVDSKNSLQLSYSRRINRPGVWMLNPFHSYTDARNFRAGNPDLKPEYTDAYEGGYLLNTNKFNFYSGLYFRKTKGGIERITLVVDVDTTLQIPVNLAKRQSYGAEANATLDLVKWWTFSGNINVYRVVTNGNFNGVNYKSDNLGWDTRINSRMRFPKDVDFQVLFTYRGPQQTTQGSLKPFYMLNAGISKDLFKNNATLTFNVRDVLNSRRFRYVINQQDFYSENEFRWSKRSYSVTLTYRLNQKKKPAKRSENGDNNNGEGADY